MGNFFARRKAAGDLAGDWRFERVDAGRVLDCGNPRLFRERKGFGSGDSLAFGNVIKTIGTEILERVDLAAGPADFEQFDFCGRAKSEVHAQIVLRKIAAAAADFVDLLMGFGFAGNLSDATDAGSDAAAVGLGANGSNLDPIIFQRRVTAKKLGKIVDAIDHDVDVAVVVEIAEGSAARRRRSGD